MSVSIIFSSLIQVNTSFSHVSKEGGETCFHFKRMRRLASKVVKAKAFWTVTEMLTSTVYGLRIVLGKPKKGVQNLYCSSNVKFFGYYKSNNSVKNLGVRDRLYF